MPDVKPGQIWQDCDKRSNGRKLRVIAVGETHATVQEVVTGPTTRKPRQTRIRLDRFRPTSTGYRCIEKATLVEEVAAAIETAGGTPPTTCPPAAPESTHANETTPTPHPHHPEGERPSETLTALREHVEDLDDLIRQERAIHEETIRRAEQAEAAIARIRDLHHEYKIYDDCGHDAHNDNDERVVETDDGRYVCADGYRYSVCHECCTASGEPTEHCAETHDHTDGWQCATILALTEAGAVSEPTGSGRER